MRSYGPGVKRRLPDQPRSSTARKHGRPESICLFALADAACTRRLINRERWLPAVSSRKSRKIRSNAAIRSKRGSDSVSSLEKECRSVDRALSGQRDGSDPQTSTAQLSGE